MKDLLAQNALLDAQDMAQSLGREFVDSDMVQMPEHGIDLPMAAVAFISEYNGDNRFAKTVLKKRLAQYGKLTAPQGRAALNIMRQELLGLDYKSKSEDKKLDCFVCGEEFPSWDALTKHKEEAHKRFSSVEEMPNVDGTEKEAVIEVTEATKGLDLSNLPDGRYAAPDVTGKNDYIFLMVKRVRKTAMRDRRYTYGKIITGREMVLAGTIEVKIWSSDSKELIGEQKPGDVYRGKYEDELELIMLSPEAWALLFGKLAGHCCICGKTLTDDESRAIGMGIECERKNDYWVRPKYSYIGKDRPDQDKVNPEDERRLSPSIRAKYWGAA